MKRHLPLLLAWVLVNPVWGAPEVRPVIMIKPVGITSPKAFAKSLDAANRTMREKHDVPLFLRGYLELESGGTDAAGFVLSPAPSMTVLSSNLEAFAGEPTGGPVRDQLNATSPTAAVRYFLSVRFDGTHRPGWLCNFIVQSADEPDLLARVDALASMLGSPDQPTPHLNVFRLIAGSAPETHLVSINTESAEVLHRYLDRLATLRNPLDDPGVTLLRRTLYQELVP